MLPVLSLTRGTSNSPGIHSSHPGRSLIIESFRAVISDVWDAKTRGRALAVFTVAPFIGPAVGPTVAGFMHVSGWSSLLVVAKLRFFLRSPQQERRGAGSFGSLPYS